MLYTKEVSSNYKRAQRKRESKVCNVAVTGKKRSVFLNFQLDCDQPTPLGSSRDILLGERDFHTDLRSRVN